jgi:hypothetical protein
MPDAVKIDARLPLVAELKLKRDSRGSQARDISLVCPLHIKLPARNSKGEAGCKRAQQGLLAERSRLKRALQKVPGRLREQWAGRRHKAG